VIGSPGAELGLDKLAQRLPKLSGNNLLREPHALLTFGSQSDEKRQWKKFLLIGSEQHFSI
jgi:hypothetical protein